MLAVAAGAQTSSGPEEHLPPWAPGTLEIHQISTGRGNSALFIFPDGTTLLVDAGAAADGLPDTAPHPNGSRSPGAWIARYISRHVPAGNSGLDYALITHFHADHMGEIVPSSPLSANGAYRLSGITEVDAACPIRCLIDRGWPDYNYPVPSKDQTMANYRAFLETRTRGGMRVERFKPGVLNQIRLLKDASRYPTFEIRNVIGNGQVWTGAGESARPTFPSLESLPASDYPNENMCSLGFRLQYGHFRYFTGR